MKTAALLLAPLLATATSLVSRDDIGSLNQLFRDNAHKVYFGAATDKEKLEQGENANIIRDRFGQITPEYSAQWKETQPEANVWTKYKSNQVFNWAQDHQKIIRGHALLWHESVPEYINRITDKAEMRRAIETHIGEMMNPWKGKIRSWDVVNEIFVDNDPDGKFRDSAFYRVLGEEFVSVAFRAAHNADPDAKLYINDYNLDKENDYKVQTMVRKVKQWREQDNIPIHGIGSQSHLQDPSLSVGVESALRLLATAAEEVAITELDITGANPEDYRNVVRACYNVPSCVGITVWGIRDADSYRSQDTPLLFDNNWAPKDAFYSIRDYLGNIKP